MHRLRTSNLRALAYSPVLAATLLAACGGEPEDRLSGTWTTGRIELTLTRAGVDYEGKLVIGASEYALRATPLEDLLEGTFRSGTSEYPFRCKLAGEVLQIESGGSRHELKRKLPAPERNPLAEVGNPLAEIDTQAAPVNTPVNPPVHPPAGG